MDSTTNDGVDLIIGPLRGPFFHINEYFPGTFTPTIEVQLHTVLKRFMLARKAHATGEGGIPATANKPSMEIVEAKTRLIIPYVQMQDKEAQDAESRFFQMVNKPYTTEKRGRCWVSNTPNGPGVDLDPMTNIDESFPIR